MQEESPVVTTQVATQEVSKPDTMEVETNIEAAPESGADTQSPKAPEDAPREAEAQEQVKRSRSEKRKAEKERILQENATLKERNRLYEEQIKGKPQEAKKTDGEPNIADYDDVMLYYRDLNKYDAAQLLKSDREQQKQSSMEEARSQAYAERLRPIIEAKPELVNRLVQLEQGGFISKTLEAAVEDSPLGDKITEYLADLPDHIIGQLSNLEEKQLYRAIGVLEAQLGGQASKDEAPRVTQARPPIKPPGNTTKTDRSINSFTQEEIENMPNSEFMRLTGMK